MNNIIRKEKVISPYIISTHTYFYSFMQKIKVYEHRIFILYAFITNLFVNAE